MNKKLLRKHHSFSQIIPTLAFVMLSLTSLSCATSHSIVQLSNGVTAHTFRRDHNNAHVVSKGDRFFLIDSGLERSAKQLADDMRLAGFPPERLSAVVLTHGHADHAGGAHYFRTQLGTPIIAGKADEPILYSGHNDRPCPTDFIARMRLESDYAERFTPIVPDQNVPMSMELEQLTGIQAHIEIVPGHTPGSLVVVLPDAVFVGDLFRGSMVGSDAEVHFYMCDLEDNRRDVQLLLEKLAPSAQLFFPGHFGPVHREHVKQRFK